MKVAIVYNDAPTEYYKSGAAEKKKELGFEAYFDVDDYDPDYEFEYLAESLRKQGCDCYVLNIMDNIDRFFEDLEVNKPDVIFNLMEIYKNKAKLEMCFAGLFELMDIPYTGADPVALGSCQSKILTKQILSASGINTARYFVCDNIKKLKKPNLNYPLIVKPAYEDASVGIENESIVTDYKGLKKRVEHVLTYYKQKALVEEYIEGREINVAVFGNEKAKALPISEIDFSTMPDNLYNIISYQAKWDPYNEAYHKTIPIWKAMTKNA
ncbi:MAG TPA: ATP-grasp domain-containing protein [Ignavibacteriales bacterium]|nr:ATP-grasp domain-containing protein [Ignavibacteriales bacterium]